MADRFGLHYRMSVFLFFKRIFAGLPKPVGDHVHRLLQVERLPLAGIRAAIFDFRFAGWTGDQLKAVCSFRAEMPAGNRRLGIALDTDQLAVFVKRKLPAANTAIRTHRSRHLRAIELWRQIARALGHRLRSSAVGASPNLLYQRPT